MKTTLTLLSILFFIHLVYNRIPVIIDTDIGKDFDDQWALALLIASDEVDIKLVVTATGNTSQRAQIVAKFLNNVGRSEIPIGIGIPDTHIATGSEYNWAKNFSLSEYKGNIYQDGVQAMIDCVRETPEVVVLEIAPATNLGMAISMEPELFSNNVRVVAMSGSINKGYGNSPIISCEYNVCTNITASQIMYNLTYNTFPMTTAPLDTSGIISIDGQYMERLKKAQFTNLLVANLFDAYRYWLGSVKIPSNSDTIYDAVAARLVYSTEFLDITPMNIYVNQTGYTVPYTNANIIEPALEWTSNGQDGFQNAVVNTLLSWK